MKSILLNIQDLVSLDILQGLKVSIGPANLDLVDSLVCSKTKVESQIALGLITSSASYLTDLRHGSCLDGNSGSDGTAAH